MPYIVKLLTDEA